MSWWYCLTHGEVEQGDGCPNRERLGPYDSREQAAQAPERTRERTAALDAQEAAEDDWGSR